MYIPSPEGCETVHRIMIERGGVNKFIKKADDFHHLLLSIKINSD